MSLLSQKEELSNTNLEHLFANDKQRFANMHMQVNGLLMDYSKQLLTTETIKLLIDEANKVALKGKIADLFSGAIVNHTEQRPALHTELRNPETNNLSILRVLDQMESFVIKAVNQYTDVIVLGIGGSDLGPHLVCEALSNYAINSIKLHFVANVDPDTLVPLLQQLDPKKTLCIINSKTFTTIETLTNARYVREWLKNDQLIGVTANKDAAIAWGIQPDNIFEFWDWVGGRFSVWSAVGLPIALSIGMDNFRRFLAGAHAMDKHFNTASFAENMPVLMALLGIWNINYLNHKTLAIIPYADGLQLLAPYLQQLEMESNGKASKQQTAPIIWGGVGCNAQHAYMQLLHQGTQVVPIDFLVAAKSSKGMQELQDLLVASCIGQSQALMQGRSTAEEYKNCPGNRPSTTLMFAEMTPEILGNIIALYEHKVYVQGILWGIESFDQWGVQLGKELIKSTLQVMQTDDYAKLDSSTVGLLKSYKDFLSASDATKS